MAFRVLCFVLTGYCISPATVDHVSQHPAPRPLEAQAYRPWDLEFCFFSVPADLGSPQSWKDLVVCDYSYGSPSDILEDYSVTAWSRRSPKRAGSDCL